LAINRAFPRKNQDTETNTTSQTVECTEKGAADCLADVRNLGLGNGSLMETICTASLSGSQPREWPILEKRRTESTPADVKRAALTEREGKLTRADFGFEKRFVSDAES
jgi:hypothetical protein